MIVFDRGSSLHGLFSPLVELVSFSSLSILFISCPNILSLIGNEIKVITIARVNRISVAIITYVFVVSMSGLFIINPMPTADRLKWTHCRGQNTVKISKIIENHRHSFSRNRPQPALHNRDSGEVVGHYRNGYNELIHRKELVPSGTVSDKHLHT